MMVLVLPLGGDLGSGVSQGRKQYFVRELVLNGTLEALDEPILHRLFGFGIERCDFGPPTQ